MCVWCVGQRDDGSESGWRVQALMANIMAQPTRVNQFNVIPQKGSIQRIILVNSGINQVNTNAHYLLTHLMF